MNKNVKTLRLKNKNVRVSKGYKKLKFAGLIIFAFVLILLIAGNVLALGITPGRTHLEYKEGEEHTVKFTVVNSDRKDVNLVVFVQGEFNQSISLSEVSFHMSAGEESKTLSYTIKIPKLSPGQHMSEIVVLQLPEKSAVSEAYVGAVVGVATQVSIFVPYPGKYAEADFNVIGPDTDGKINFVIPVISRGELDLARVRATIDIYTSLNEKIETISTNEVAIPSQQRREVVGLWDSSKAQPGPYRAVATLLYDDSSLKLEKEFNVGVRRLSVEGVEVNDFSLGEIAKFEILVENKWSQAIQGVFAEMVVYNERGEVMANFKSPVYDIPSLTKTLMTAFWDTAGVGTGTYDASLFLKYGSNSEQQDLKLEVKEDEINIIGVGYVISKGRGRSAGIFSSGITIILIVGIIVLVLINLSWFLFFRRRLKK